MEDELRVDPRVVARVTIYIWCARLQLCKQECNMQPTGVAFGGDSPKFDTDRMLTLFKVSERVAVPTYATIELAPTAERAAGEAEPEVLLEVAF